VLVVHLEHHVQHALVDAAQDAETVLRIVTEMLPCRRLARPVIRVAVDERCGAQRERPQIVRSGRGRAAGRGRRCRRRGRLRQGRIGRAVGSGQWLAVQEVGAPLERRGDGLRYRLE